MQTILHILKLNAPRTGVSKTTGRPYDMQDAECVIYNDDGEPIEVGVLMIPDSLRETVSPGFFLGTFALRASHAKNGGRAISAVLTGLQPRPSPSIEVDKSPKAEKAVKA
jgi:hypothetical protein